MPTGQKQSGQTNSNPDEQYNTAKELADREFDFSQNINDGQHDRIEGYDRSADGLDEYDEKKFGARKSGEYTDAHGDKVRGNYNAGPSSDQEDLQDRENPKQFPKSSSLYSTEKKKSSGSTWSKLLAGSKRFGPTGGAVGLILALFGGASIILAPGALLITLEKALTNDGSDSTRMNIIMRRAYVGALFKKGACNDSSIKCKMTSMSTQQKERWEKLGWKIDSEENNGRHKVTKMTSPDGVEIDSARKFQDYADNTVEGRKHANRVVNIRASFFQNSKFDKVLKKYNLSKSKHLQASTNRDKTERTKAINQSFDDNTGADPDRDSRLKKVGDSIKDKAKGPAANTQKKMAAKSKLGFDAGTAAACAAYDVTRIAIATVKAKWTFDLISFAFPFIQAGAQLEDQGNIEPEVVENISDRLTWYHSQEYAEKQVSSGADPLALEKVNKTAMDSQGVQMAIFGDFTKLTEFAKTYTTAYVGGKIVGNASDVIRLAQETFPGGKEGIRLACLGNSLASLAASARCAAGPVAAAVCAGAGVGGIIIAYTVGDDVIMWAVNQITDEAIEAIANANLTSSLKGVDAGNALAAGVGLLLSNSSMGSGLRPASNVTAVKQFISATDELDYKYGEELARLEAKETPFDMTNQYSFAGQIASAFNPYRSNDKTLFSQLLNGMAVATSPLAKMSTASALYSQPSNMTSVDGAADNRLAKCEDQEMKDIGAVCDWSGRMIGVTSDNVIKKASSQANGEGEMIDETIDYMLKGKHINEEGAVIDDKDNKYKKYKEYCTEERVDPLGTTTKSIMGEGNFIETTTGLSAIGAQEDEKWFTGERCLGKDPADQEMLDHFAVYLNICETQYATAENTESCWSTQPVAAVTSTTGEWVIPTVGPCTSPYGQRWGKLHAGIDIANPASPPVVAPTDMTITSAGMNNGGYGYMVTGKATDGSEYSFRFGHLAGQPPVKVGDQVTKGQEIGTMGTTGNSSGIHLHFEIFPPGGNPASFSGAIDPVPVLKEHGVGISC